MKIILRKFKPQLWLMPVIVVSVLANSSENGESNWDSTPEFSQGNDITDAVIVEDIIVPNGEYRYASFGKPDPFSPPQFKEKAVSQSEEIPILSPLQVSLDRLNVSGVWELDDGTKHALIQTEDGQGIITTVGDPIGPSGKVTDITDQGVYTRQYKFRNDGSREFSDVMLKFGYQKNGESAPKEEVITKGVELDNKSTPAIPNSNIPVTTPVSINGEGL